MGVKLNSRYKSFGDALLTLRMKAGIGKQTEFARLVKSTQQTVSRWERGESRPRDKDFPLIASVLGTSVDDLLLAAGYVQRTVIATFDQPFPIDALTPDSFERFCFFLLRKLYPDADVHRAGGTGHTQHGLDIEVRLADGSVHTFQCKRESEFGPAKVERAIAKHTKAAVRKFILLTRIASPQARDAVARHPGWVLWDKEDISVRIRELPKVEQRELVDIFFRGQRLALLGETEPGPWQTTHDFFAPYMDRRSAFNHQWQLVGRDQEIATLRATLDDNSVLVAMLSGAGGAGKSRLILNAIEDFAASHPYTLVRMLSTTEDVTNKSLSELGSGAKLLVVDDAHDRNDLPILFNFVANPVNAARLVLAFRPYGQERIRLQAASINLRGPLVNELVIPRLSQRDSTELATEVLRAYGGPESIASEIASITGDCPLATVMGAQVVAQDKLHPQLIQNQEQFRSTLLGRFQQFVTGTIASGQDSDRLTKLLRVLALVQPFAPDDRTLLDFLENVEHVAAPDTNRLLRLLMDAGVLFKRGGMFRLSPDLLADYIIETSCITVGGGSTGYAEKVFDSAPAAYLEHVLVNLGKLDWRRNVGDTSESRLLEDLWSRLRWKDDYVNEHIKAAAAAAYYQPRQALDFARRLVEEGHGDSEEVCRIIKHAAYNLASVPEACALLWTIGKGDPRPTHRHPEHAIRILTELASPEPNKPTEFVLAVVDFALGLVSDADSWTGPYTPLNVLSGALATEGHLTTAATRRAITLTAFTIPRESMVAIRRRIVRALFELLKDANLRRAFLAAEAVSGALQAPHGMLNLKVPEKERAGWLIEFVDTISDLNALLDTVSLPAPVLVRIAQSVSWHAFYGPSNTAVPARNIIARLERDLHTRCVRLLMDGWGHGTWPLNTDTPARQAHEVEMDSVADELARTYPEPASRLRRIEHCLDEITTAAGSGVGAPQIFIDRLLADSELARSVLGETGNGLSIPLAPYTGMALGKLLQFEPSKTRALVEERLRKGDGPDLLPIAEGYARFEPRDGYTEFDRKVLRFLIASTQPAVLGYASLAARQVASRDHAFAIELLTGANLATAPHLAHEFLIWLCNEKTVPFASITDDQIRRVLRRLRSLQSLEDYWVVEFLRKATQRNSELIVEFARDRLQDAMDQKDWSKRILDSGYEHGGSLRLLTQTDGATHLKSLLSWAVERIDSGEFAYRFGELIDGLCGPYDKSFVSALESWLAGASPGHLRVAAAVLRHAPTDFLYQNPTFVDWILRLAKSHGNESLERMYSALYACAFTGGGSTVPGEPFPRDLKMKEHAERMLKIVRRFDPTFDFYTNLLRHAEDGIARQHRERVAMDEEEE